MLFLLFLSDLFLRHDGIFYVGAADKLPEPLKKAEEEYYVAQASDGDLFARDKLIEHNLRLVV